MLDELKQKELRGKLIRLGKQKKALARAKRQGDSELKMQIQSNVADLEREVEELKKFEAEEAKTPALGQSAPAPVGTSGITPGEAEIAVGIVLAVEEALLSAVAAQKFKLDVSDKERGAMRDSLLVSAEKRLSPQAKAKADLFFLLGAFALPLFLALPKALEARRLKQPRPVEKEPEEKPVEAVGKTSAPSGYDEKIAGPLPPVVQ